jgi:hypothetical protein
MKKSDIAKARLFNQQIAATKFTKPEEIVAWLGAVQAQDYLMARWAIGLRLPGSNAETIEAAVASGKILRTHILRPTWHFVASEDIRWMLALSAPRIRPTGNAMLRFLALDDKILRRSARVIEKSLAKHGHLTRAELKHELDAAGIRTDEQRMSWHLFNPELDGLICSGAPKGKQQTYALLDERAPKFSTFSRDESIAELTRRYFTSHAPATLKDFVWWSNLAVADAKKGLEMNKSMLVSETIEDQTFWMPHSIAVPPNGADSLYLLPAFDEFMVAYKDRSASLAPKLTKQAITGNGIFKPIIVVNGNVAGVWKRSVRKDALVIEKILFRKLKHAETEAFEQKAKEFAAFEGKIWSAGSLARSERASVQK